MMYGWRAYRAYLGVKLHFKPDSKYDFFEMKGGVSATEASYKKRNDKWLFAKLDKEFPEYTDLLLFLAVNFFKNEKTFIRPLTQGPARALFDEYKAFEQSLTYNFTKELTDVLRACDDNVDIFTDLFTISSSSTHPEIFHMLVREEVSPWFFILIDGLTDFVDELGIEDPVLWKPWIDRLRAFQPFMTINWDSVRKALEREISTR